MVAVHPRPFLRTRDMGRSHRVPDDDVPIFYGPIRPRPFRQPVAAFALIDIIAGSVHLGRIVRRYPQVGVKEPRSPTDAASGCIGKWQSRITRHKHVTDRLSKPVLY